MDLGRDPEELYIDPFRDPAGVGNISIDIDEGVFVFDTFTGRVVDGSSLGCVDSVTTVERLSVFHNCGAFGVELIVLTAEVVTSDGSLGVVSGVSSAFAILTSMKGSVVALSSSRIRLLLDSRRDDESNEPYRDGKRRERSSKDALGGEWEISLVGDSIVDTGELEPDDAFIEEFREMGDVEGGWSRSTLVGGVTAKKSKLRDRVLDTVQKKERKKTGSSTFDSLFRVTAD
jgi:hypothetical protein